MSVGRGEGSVGGTTVSLVFLGVRGGRGGGCGVKEMVLGSELLTVVVVVVDVVVRARVRVRVQVRVEGRRGGRVVVVVGRGRRGRRIILFFRRRGRRMLSVEVVVVAIDDDLLLWGRRGVLRFLLAAESVAHFVTSLLLRGGKDCNACFEGDSGVVA